MLSPEIQAQADALLQRLKQAGWREREAIKEELLAFARDRFDDDLRDHLEGGLKSLPLEARWEVEEVLSTLAPPPPPPPEEEEEEEEEPQGGPLRMSDLVEVYSDPRGLALFTDKAGKRWFVSQIDPYTGQPTLGELPPHQIDQVKAQLRGSPYWRIGSGVAP